jgi:hypothetical protein
MKLFNTNLLILVLILVAQNLKAQQTNELPLSWSLVLSDYGVPTYVSPALDMEQVKLEDSKRESEAKVANFAKFVPCNLSLLNSGKWTTLPNGDRIWRLNIVAEKSKGIVLYYRDFYMPQGAKLFVYTNDRLDVQGAFTNANN